MSRAISTIGAIVVVVLLIVVGVGGYFVGNTTVSGKTTTQTVTTTQVGTGVATVTTTQTGTVTVTGVQAARKQLKIAGIFSVASTEPFAIAESSALASAAKFFNSTGYLVHLSEVFDVAIASSASVFQGYAQSGYNIIFASDVSFEPIVVPAVSSQYPNVGFYGVNWYPPYSSNVANLDQEPQQGEYIEGIIAGSLTKTNVVGFETGFAFATTIAGYNAFLLGARSVNPSIKGAFVTTGSWVDPVAAADGLSALQGAGADVVMAHGEDPFAPEAAEKSVYTFGMFENQSVPGNQYVLTSQIDNGTLMHIEAIDSYLAGTFGGQNFEESIATGGFYLTPCSPLVPASACQKAMGVVTALKQGVFSVPFISTMPSNSVNATITTTSSTS